MNECYTLIEIGAKELVAKKKTLEPLAKSRNYLQEVVSGVQSEIMDEFSNMSNRKFHHFFFLINTELHIFEDTGQSKCIEVVCEEQYL